MSAVTEAEMAKVKTSSNGVWQGDDPLHFAFPLLILQALLILLLSRLLALMLRPLRQPKVIAEIVAGILLGPSALGRNKSYLRALFPPWSAPVLESVASLGLLFFLFLVGLELDLRSVRRSGRQAFAIAAAGISLPFACGVGVAFVLRRQLPGAAQAGYAPFLVFMGVALSITAFPVLARILAELKLLTTPIGETALAAAAFNDVAAWVLLALAVAISGSGDHRSPIVSLWVLLSGAAFVAVWMLAVKPAMAWVARRSDGQGGGEDGEFAGRVTERVEDLVSELLLPLYFASSGLKTDVATIRGGGAWGMLALVIGTACAGKIAGTFGVAMACGMSAREAVVLGVVMNTKGLVELIVLNIGRERKGSENTDQSSKFNVAYTCLPSIDHSSNVSSEQVAHGVCVVFFGGPDDREALELAERMAEHPGVQVTVMRFVDGKAGSEEHAEVTLQPSNTKNADKSYTFSTAIVDTHKEKELDEAAVAEFRQRMGPMVRYEERVVAGNVVEEVVSIGKSREYGLVVVGKGRLPSAMVAELAVRAAEHPELGPIGDALASAGQGVTSSVLVVQQHDMSNADEVPVSVVVVVDGHGHGHTATATTAAASSATTARTWWSHEIGD
uniref:Cation/H+ exchanger domain-containing protein n=1 Tax=Oryza brachyantha TaxID=4533 RepID=J3M3C3_ORYBR